MEGVKGVNTSWIDFGKWMHDELIVNTDALPASTITHVKKITSDATSDIEKAKIIYKYVQDKTRYISVQVGIGGWKPMLAKDVDRLGYGDCKGLTNYTKALLKAVGVNSYYTVINGSHSIKDLDSDFSSLQGNHVILGLPNNDDYIWLECTSQSVPFGYNANFTDDRDALVLTSEGGKIVHTKSYNAQDNAVKTQAQIKLNENGDLQAQLQTRYLGTKYSRYRKFENTELKKQKLFLKEHWGYLNNLKIKAINLKNNKADVVFNENIDVSVEHYASNAGGRFLVKPNIFNRKQYVPKRYSKRKTPFIIERGSTNTASYTIEIPTQFEIEMLPDTVAITTKFGAYTMAITKSSSGLNYQRQFILNKGYYQKEDYNAFRDFMLKVKKKDNIKFVLKKKTNN